MSPARCRVATSLTTTPFGLLLPAALPHVTTKPAALATGDLNGLFLVATWPSRHQATATMTATPRRPTEHGQAWWVRVWYVPIVLRSENKDHT